MRGGRMIADLPPDPPTESSRLDQAGTLASALCVIHCIVVALAPSLLVGMGLGGVMSHEFEWIATGTAVIIGLLAGIQGYRNHGSAGILVGFVTMSIALLSARLMEDWIHEGGTLAGQHVPYLPVILAVLAGTGLVWLHIINLRNRQPQSPA